MKSYQRKKSAAAYSTKTSKTNTTTMRERFTAVWKPLFILCLTFATLCIHSGCGGPVEPGYSTVSKQLIHPCRQGPMCKGQPCYSDEDCMSRHISTSSSSCNKVVACIDRACKAVCEIIYMELKANQTSTTNSGDTTTTSESG